MPKPTTEEHLEAIRAKLGRWRIRARRANRTVGRLEIKEAALARKLAGTATGADWLKSNGLPIVKGDPLNDMTVTPTKPVERPAPAPALPQQAVPAVAPQPLPGGDLDAIPGFLARGKAAQAAVDDVTAAASIKAAADEKAAAKKKASSARSKLKRAGKLKAMPLQGKAALNFINES